MFSLHRMRLLQADNGAPSGGSGSGTGTGAGTTSPTTDPPANPTPGTGGQSGPAGQGAGAPTPGQNGGTNPTQPTNPQQPVAKYTDDDMKAARLAFQADADKKQKDAEEKARLKEAEDQGNFKKALDELKPKHEATTAKVERYQPLLETWLNESVAQWPEKMKAKIDAETDFDRKLDLFEDLRDIAADFAQAQGGEKKPPMANLQHIPGAAGGSGTGAGGGGNANPVQNMMAKRYPGPPQPKSN